MWRNTRVRLTHLKTELTLSDERRDSYRLAINETEAWVDGPRGSAEIELRELSASGGGLVVPAGSIGGLGDAPLLVRLSGTPSFRVSMAPVRNIEQAGGLVWVGARFDEMDRRSLASLSQFLLGRWAERSRRLPESVVARDVTVGNFHRHRVRRLLRYYLVSRTKLLKVYRGETGLPLLLATRRLAVEAAREVIETEVVTGTGAQLEPGEEYTFTFGSAGAVGFFQAAVWRRSESDVVLTMPPEIRQAGFRGSFRYRLDASAGVNVTLPHPRLADVRLHKPVLDASSDGLSFPLDPATDLLFAGEAMRDIRIAVPEGEVSAEAILRSVSPGGDPGQLLGGLDLVGFASARDQDRWQRYVFHAVHPRSRLGTPETVGDAWHVLESSGYLQETTEELRAGLAKQFYFSWQRHAANPDVGRYIVQYKGGRPIGTVAASLAYPRAWLTHHFGIDEQERKADRHGMFELARELYCGMQHLMRDIASLEYFIICADVGRSWNRMVYGEFIERFGGHEDVLYDTYKVYKCIPCDQLPVSHVAPDGVIIVEADEELLACLCEHLAAELPALEVEALSLHLDGLLLNEFSQSCRDNGYVREREIFFAEEDGVPLAALVVEIGEEGTNIFGLLNRCWFVYLQPQAAVDDRVKYHLLRRAVRYYANKAKLEFILIGSWGGEPEDLLEPLGITYRADGFRFIGRRSVLPAWMSHVNELMNAMRS